MPKRGKKPKGDASLFPYEGRPTTQVTLGNFITSAAVAETLSINTEESAPAPGTNNEEDSGELRSSDSGAAVGRTATESSSFTIMKSKKGKIPICLENRAKGKKVTVISNVTGNAEALLTDLKKRTGSGGVVRPGSIEIQGDHQDRVSEFLKSHPCVKPWKS